MRRAWSNAHRHDDGDIVVRRLRPDDDGVELAADADQDALLVECREHVEEIPRIEPEGHLASLVLHGHLVEALATVRTFARKAHRAASKRELYASRAVARRD